MVAELAEIPFSEALIEAAGKFIKKNTRLLNLYIASRSWKRNINEMYLKIFPSRRNLTGPD